MSHYGVPGVAVTVLRDGRAASLKGYGSRLAGRDFPVGPDTLFSVGSVSKVATAALCLRLVAQGKLDLDQGVGRWLRRWRLPEKLEGDTSGISLRMLLSHTAGFNVHGFKDMEPSAPLPTLLQTLNGTPPALNKPLQRIDRAGSRSRYSGGGYMVAQAWQVSRIIDLLEQSPTVIDPYHVGVTGCSRNGKGAFAGGVFDNRIALTIPCESGIGGTPALRLKEQLDPGDNSTAEWPYHAISYVRWLSEVALGPFATANSASGDNTDRLPVDMHEAMALIAPRAIYIVDNPGITNLDPKSAYVTAMAGKAIFEALGVGDHFAMQGASGTHCSWRSQYDASLTAMINKFLKGQTSTTTGNMATDLGSKPTATQYWTWSTAELAGSL
jgi:hypothetical protein